MRDPRCKQEYFALTLYLDSRKIDKLMQCQQVANNKDYTGTYIVMHVPVPTTSFPSANKEPFLYYEESALYFVVDSRTQQFSRRQQSRTDDNLPYFPLIFTCPYMQYYQTGSKLDNIQIEL